MATEQALSPSELLADLHRRSEELLIQTVLEPALSEEQFEAVRRFADELIRYVAQYPEMAIDWATNAPLAGEAYLPDHCFNVMLLAGVYGLEADYSDMALLALTLTAFLHDLGMFDLPYSLIYRTGKFTEAQRAEMQQHPYLGVRRLRHLEVLPEAVLFSIQDEHEQEDGSGYPEQKDATTIQPLAKVIRVLDLYEALIHRRPYRDGWLSPHQAMQELILRARKGELSKTVVQCWLRRLAYYPIGSYVRLNNGFLGKVVSVHRGNPLQPVLVAFGRDRGERWEDYRILDLEEHPHLFVASVLTPPEVEELETHGESREHLDDAAQAILTAEPPPEEPPPEEPPSEEPHSEIPPSGSPHSEPEEDASPGEAQ